MERSLMTRRKAVYSHIPADAVFVSVYCSGRADPSGVPFHHDDPWRITTYYLDEDMPPGKDGTIQWMEAAGEYWTPTGQVIVLGTAPTRLGMVGDLPVTQEQYRANRSVFDDGDSRSRYKLTCRRRDCGLSVVFRVEKLMPNLARLAALGVKEVSLVGLAATVRTA